MSIPLPPGCRHNKNIFINCKGMTDEIYQWFQDVGGKAWTEMEYDSRGKEKSVRYVSYGNSKRCYHWQSTGLVRFVFSDEDEQIASMFVLRFMEDIVNDAGVKV